MILLTANFTRAPRSQGALRTCKNQPVTKTAVSSHRLREVDWNSIRAVVTETAAGTTWLARVGALAGVIAIATVSRQRDAIWVATAICGAIALASLTWSGHGAADDGRIGLLHLAADVVHLLAAGLWVGALAGFLLLLQRVQTVEAASLHMAHRALEGFAKTGTITVAVIMVTGLING